MGSVIGIASRIATCYFRRSQSHDREAIVLTWAWLRAAGLLALTAYAITGTWISFFIGIVTLVIMHVFSPNRFQREPNA
jgi:hypothetical protein